MIKSTLGTRRLSRPLPGALSANVTPNVSAGARLAASLYTTLASLGLAVMTGILPRNISDTLTIGSPVVGFGGVALLYQGYVVIQYGGCLLTVVFELTQYSLKHLYFAF